MREREKERERERGRERERERERDVTDNWRVVNDKCAEIAENRSNIWPLFCSNKLSHFLKIM